MKNLIKYLLQEVLGYQRYLFAFAKHKIRTLENDAKEGDFFAFLSIINKEGSLLDVGANIGIMTYYLSKHFPDRITYAIEPLPSNIETLMRVIDHYRLENVELIPKAVGDKREELEMILPKQGKVKMQGLAHVVHDSIINWNEGDQYNVSCATLDQLIGEDKVAGIKMDIENYEFFALTGARKMLERDHPLVYLELWENENREKCFELLQELGYVAYVSISKELVRYDPQKHQKQNFIFR